MFLASKALPNSKHKQIENIQLPDGDYSLSFIVRVSKDRVIAGDGSNTLLVISNNTCTPHSLGEYYAWCAVMCDGTLYIGCKDGHLLMMDPLTLTINHTLKLSHHIVSLLVMPDNSIICG